MLHNTCEPATNSRQVISNMGEICYRTILDISKKVINFAEAYVTK